MEAIAPVLDSATVARLQHLAETVSRPGEDLIGRLVDIFVDDSRTRFVECGHACRAGDHVVAGRAAHTSKGAASNLGATRVVAAARIIEESCQVAGAVDDEALVVLDNALIEAGLALRALQS